MKIENRDVRALMRWMNWKIVQENPPPVDDEGAKNRVGGGKTPATDVT